MSLNQSWALTELRVIFSMAGLSSNVHVLICWNQSWRVKTVLLKCVIMKDCNLEHQGLALSVLTTKIIQYWWYEAWKGLVSGTSMSAALLLSVSSSLHLSLQCATAVQNEVAEHCTKKKKQFWTRCSFKYLPRRLQHVSSNTTYQWRDAYSSTSGFDP